MRQENHAQILNEKTFSNQIYNNHIKPHVSKSWHYALVYKYIPLIKGVFLCLISSRWKHSYVYQMANLKMFGCHLIHPTFIWLSYNINGLNCFLIVCNGWLQYLLFKARISKKLYEQLKCSRIEKKLHFTELNYILNDAHLWICNTYLSLKV